MLHEGAHNAGSAQAAAAKVAPHVAVTVLKPGETARLALKAMATNA